MPGVVVIKNWSLRLGIYKLNLVFSFTTIKEFWKS